MYTFSCTHRFIFNHSYLRASLLHSFQHPPRILSFSQPSMKYRLYSSLKGHVIWCLGCLQIYLSKGLCLLVCMFQPLSATFLVMVVSHDLNHLTRAGARLVELLRGGSSLRMLTVSFIFLLYHFFSWSSNLNYSLKMVTRKTLRDAVEIYRPLTSCVLIL